VLGPQLGERADPEQPHDAEHLLAQQAERPLQQVLAAGGEAPACSFPMLTADAPRAMALTTSEPRRMPLSKTTPACPATASTVAGRTSIAPGWWSSWRPPWLETYTTSAPCSTASFASSGLVRPFTISGRSVMDRSQSKSSQVKYSR
jgi:hypothetical protein